LVMGIAIAICLLAPSVQADGFKSAVRLQVPRSGDVATGTAVWVTYSNENWLLTAYHVLRGVKCASSTEGCVHVTAGEHQPPLALATLSTEEWRLMPSLGVMALRLSADGVAKLKQTGASPSLLRKEAISCVGQAVVAVGNPTYEILKRKVPSYNYVGSGDVGARSSVYDLLPLNAYESIARQTPLLVLNGTTITYGYSGGPVFFQSGPNAQYLLGLVQGGDPDDGTKSWAIPADVIAEQLSAATASGVSAAFAAGYNWPADGFKSSVYSRMDKKMEFASTPDPLTITYGKPFELSIMLPSGDPRLAKAGLPKIVAEHGLSVREPTQAEEEGLVQTWRWSLVFNGPKTSKLEIHLEWGGKTFDLEATVLCPPHLLAVEAGFDMPLGKMNPNGLPSMSRPWRVSGPVSYRWGFKDTCPSCIGLRFGGPLAVLSAERNTYAPIGDDRLSQKPRKMLWGMRLEILLDARVELSRSTWLGLAAGISGEWYPYDLPSSVLDDGTRGAWGLPVEVGVGWGRLRLRMRGSYGSLPTLNARYSSPSEASFPKQQALSVPNQLWVGASLGGEIAEL
jgi:hypothetical protein